MTVPTLVGVGTEDQDNHTSGIYTFAALTTTLPAGIADGDVVVLVTSRYRTTGDLWPSHLNLPGRYYPPRTILTGVYRTIGSTDLVAVVGLYDSAVWGTSVTVLPAYGGTSSGLSGHSLISLAFRGVEFTATGGIHGPSFPVRDQLWRTYEGVTGTTTNPTEQLNATPVGGHRTGAWVSVSTQALDTRPTLDIPEGFTLLIGGGSEAHHTAYALAYRIVATDLIPTPIGPSWTASGVSGSGITGPGFILRSTPAAPAGGWRVGDIRIGPDTGGW